MNFIVLAVIAGAIVFGLFYFSGAADSAMPKSLQSTSLFSEVAVEWEHGWKTSRVTATRYNSNTMGYNIGFEYPKNAYDADRAELSDFFRARKGWVFQGGGYAGAVQYVKFKDVTDKDSANVKLKEILPELSKLITDLGNGVKVAKYVDPDAKQWPDTDAPDKTNPYWEFNNNLNVNGTQYKKVEVEPGKWQWMVDQESMKRMDEMNNQRRELWAALSTRALTDDEMKQVANYGNSINIEPMVSYYEAEKTKELNAALMKQMQLRAAAQRL